MAKKKRVLAPHKMIDASTSLSATQGAVGAFKAAASGGLMKNTKLLYAVVGLLVASALLIANKSWVVAGVVNGKPIWSWQLNRVLTSRFGKQTLEGMISEQLIADEAAKQGVVVSKEDIDKKQGEILKTLGGGNVKIDDLLKYQGITKADFDNQIRLQLTVQKILGKDLVITDDDVTRYIATNSATLTATEPAQLRAEARQAILDAKVGEKLQPWFLELKNKAKILRFL
ncbi:SurA N-terminal domain-containing protein [Candidatus Gottesmanbacteria bacterium]|nr:SurA N-terminal domain-containing protein [Candidatus Gottesmanbacteria bacterium]